MLSDLGSISARFFFLSSMEQTYSLLFFWPIKHKSQFLFLSVIAIVKSKSINSKIHVLKVAKFRHSFPLSLCTACFLFSRTNVHMGDVPFPVFVSVCFSATPTFFCQWVFWMTPYVAKPFLIYYYSWRIWFHEPYVALVQMCTEIVEALLHFSWDILCKSNKNKHTVLPDMSIFESRYFLKTDHLFCQTLNITWTYTFSFLSHIYIYSLDCYFLH